METLRRRRGFTLVEMLMVIVIIAILAALLLVAVRSASKAASNSVIKMDVSQLDMALENYRTEYGEYPPDFVGTESTDSTTKTNARRAVLRHLRKRFPRYTLTGADADAQFNSFVDQLYNNIGIKIGSHPNPNAITGSMNPSQALVFWLGGLPEVSGTTIYPNKLTGFSANPTNPIETSATTQSRVRPMFEFDAKKLIWNSSDTTQPAAFGSTTSQGGSHLVAIAYFRPMDAPFVLNSSNKVVAGWYLAALWEKSLVPPYADSTTYDSTDLTKLRWLNQSQAATGSVKPQLISAGLDGGYGAMNNATTVPDKYLPPVFPSGGNFKDDTAGAGHLDNVTNFTGSSILKDEMQP
jgi:prepilin-type N-terminal cleavage/methylation domain-containing protein